ncbi:TetR family transcriptional regulator [Longimycelium tulufanense]|uniref:TetR family transcriptional regulator n=1 Tax=Longimycelium tulufanense TaxID=907463 RepID=A0A8J3FSN3_9PSEU|nr:TetR family transcriptional regulator [Longimycelium tulufanense]
MGKADWTAAALAALAEGGVAAVAIEPLAARLGTTKGSAYWHYPSRDALLHATLERWEVEHTEAIITMVGSESDPARRLRVLLGSVLEHAAENQVEIAVLADADHPVVAPVLQRVTERRVSYLASLFAELGYGRGEARRRALLAYAAYLGHAQLLRATPEVLPAARSTQRRYLDQTIRVLTQGGGPSTG